MPNRNFGFGFELAHATYTVKVHALLPAVNLLGPITCNSAIMGETLYELDPLSGRIKPHVGSERETLSDPP